MQIACTYSAGNTDSFEMPEGRTWADVQDYYVKWDMLYVTFKDGKLWDHNLLIDPEVDTKRPISTVIMNDEGEQL